MGASSVAAQAAVRPGQAAQLLGSAEFRCAHGIRMSCYAGSMYKGISSVDMVVALAEQGMLGFLGTGGQPLREVERAVDEARARAPIASSWGANLLCNYTHADRETTLVDLFLAREVRRIEASAYLKVSADLVRYRFKGARRLPNGQVEAPNGIIVKLSRPDVAAQFMRPAAPEMVEALRVSGQLTDAEADAALHAPVAEDVCVEADSAGHTDRGVALVLVPVVQDLRDRALAEHALPVSIRVGLAGGLGTPRALAAAFSLGVDFIATGSVNQCTLEAGISDAAKDLLQAAGVTDTTFAPAGDMFELGSRVQVLSAGLQFPARANKLYELYVRHNDIDALDARTRTLLEEKYFGASIDEVWRQTQAYHARESPGELEKAQVMPKHRMALIFRWYFARTSRLAREGDAQHQSNYQIHCGPAMGAFNLWARGTGLESWRNRSVVTVGETLMHHAATYLESQFRHPLEAA